MVYRFPSKLEWQRKKSHVVVWVQQHMKSVVSLVTISNFLIVAQEMPFHIFFLQKKFKCICWNRKYKKEKKNDRLSFFHDVIHKGKVITPR